MRAHEFGWRRLRRPRRIYDPAVPTPERMLGLLALLAMGSRLPAFIQAAGLGIALGYAGAMAVSRKGCNGYSTNTGNPSPSYRAFDTDSEPPSVANLSRALTIGALTGTPIGFYKSQDSTTNLVAEVGTTLTRSAAGTIAYAQGCPLMGSDTAIKGDGTNYFAASGTTYGNVGTLATVWAGLIKATGTTSVLFAKRNGAVGYECGIDASDRLYYTIQDSGGAVTTVSAALVIGCWYHFSIVAIRAGTCQIYLQRTASGSAVDISARNLTLDSATSFTVFATSGAATPFDGSLSYLTGWTFAAGLTQADALVAIAARFRALTGLRPQASAAGVDTAPITAARNCVATLEKYNTTTSAVEYYTVGENWLRVESWWDATLGKVVMGYRSELASTNKCLQSENMATTWAKLDAGDTIAATTFIADSTDGDHGVTQDVTLTAASWVIAVEATKGNKNWLYISDDTVANCTGYFDLNTPAAGTFGAGATGGIVTRGNRVLCWMTLTGTVAAHTFKIQTADADGDKSIVGDGAAVNTTIHRVQIELGTYPSSYIATTTAAVTRAKDEFECTVVHPGAQGALVCDVFQRNVDVVTGCYFVDLSDAGATNRASLTQVAAGDAPVALVGSTGSVTGTTDLATGIVRRLGMRWKGNSLEQWVNGALDGAADTTVTAPAAMNQIAIGMDYSNANQPAVPTLLRNLRVFNTYPASMAQITRAPS